MKIRIFSLLLCVLLLLPLAAGCSTPAKADIPVVEDGKAALYICMPEEHTAQTLYARDRLVFFVQQKTGVTLGSGTAADIPASAAAVLYLGDCGTELTQKLAKGLKGKDEFRFAVEEAAIAVVADSEAFLYDAVDYLIARMSSDSAGTSLRVQGEIEPAVAGDTLSLRYLLSKGAVETESVLHSYIPHHPDGIKGTQGGCLVGNYYYQTFIKTDKDSDELYNITYLGCYDMESKTMLAYSDLLDLNHANDVTYNAKTGELFVVHNKPRYNQLSVIDPETMTLKRTVQLPLSVYAVTYNETRDQYVVGISGGRDVRILGADFQLATKDPIYASKDVEGYTTQGICSDDTFIYAVLYDGKSAQTKRENVVAVYDWYGNRVGLIYVDVDKLEPENVSVRDGQLIVLAASQKGGALYEIRPTGVKAAEAKG